MGYEDAFAAVPGVTVEWCEYLGEYTGRLVAKLRIDDVDGPRYVLDSFGSCSGCDAFESEMDYEEPDQQKLMDFGRPYVDGALTLDEVLAKLLPKPGQWYDTEEKEALNLVLKDYPEKSKLVRLLPMGSA